MLLNIVGLFSQAFGMLVLGVAAFLNLVVRGPDDAAARFLGVAVFWILGLTAICGAFVIMKPRWLGCFVPTGMGMLLVVVLGFLLVQYAIPP